MLYEPFHTGSHKMKGLLRPVLLLVIVALCFFGFFLYSHSGIFREYEAVLFSVHWMLLLSITIWCALFIFLTFRMIDLPLISLLFISIVAFFARVAASQPGVDPIVLLAGVTVGKSAYVLLPHDEGGAAQVTRHSSPVTLLVGLVFLLAFSAWWHLDMSGNYYQGPRWTGLWDNPNIYGMLMGAGLTLAIGLLTHNSKLKIKKSKLASFLGIAAGMMLVGLLMSYSRGAWLATTMALLYLAWCYGKLKWKFVLPVVLVTVAIIALFWHSTADKAPWYLKRLDLSRPSAQHRVSAWRGAFQMMRDHPLGVGWNNAVGIYNKDYLPPEGGAAALTMNSYLMLGTELGLPGLICFVAYVWLSLRGKCRMNNAECRIQAACRAGALVFVVAFWFDGGLFDLPTAALFWVFLELGSLRSSKTQKIQTTSERIVS